MDKEDFLVYQVVLEQEYLAKPGFIDLGRSKCDEPKPPLLPKSLLILNQTIIVVTVPGHRPWEDTLQILHDKFPAFPSLIMQSWQNRNGEPHLLSDGFLFSVPYRLLSQAQVDEAFLPSNWWDSFYQHYPDALGYFQLSRVGFDADRQHAVVYVENHQDGKWGSGYFWLLAKEQEKWLIKGSINVWIS